MSVLSLVDTVMLFLLLMIPGFLLARNDLLPEKTMSGIANIIMYAAMPALVLVKLLQTELTSLSVTGILCMILLPLLLGTGLLFFSKLFFLRTERSRQTVARICCAFPNCGFWSIPLACMLYPDQPKIAVCVSLFNVFNSFLLLTAGAAMLSEKRKRVCWRQTLTSPVLIAILVGVFLSCTGISAPYLELFASLLSQLATPLSMLALGAEAAKLRLRDLFWTLDMYKACLVKLVLSPMLAVSLLLLLRIFLPVSEDLFAAVFLATAVSTALSAPSMAAKYGADSGYTACLTIGTTFLCVVTMPLLYTVFSSLF